MLIPIVGQAYTEFSPILDAQTCKNWFVVQDKDGKFPVGLYPTPGLTLFSAGSGSQGRGMFETNGVCYVVIDNKFYKINSDGTRTQLGTLVTSNGRCRFISNTSAGVLNQIMISDGNNGYVYVPATNSFTQITQAAFLGCDTLTYKDGFGLFNVPGQNLFQSSNALDFANYNATFSASMTDAGEPIVALKQYKDEVWIFNSRHAEVWYNSGATNFPFAKRSSFMVTQGLGAKDSLVQSNNTMIWYSRSEDGLGFITSWNFYTPNNISTHAVDIAINSYSKTDDAFAYAYRMDGNLFYVITFPTANATWVFNFATQSWHQWTSSGTNNVQNRHLSNGFCYCYGKNLVCDYQSGNIYYLDNTNFTDNGSPILRERATKHLYQENKFISLYNFIIEIEAGIGLQNGQGSNPQIILQVSKDGGRTWGAELWQSAGKVGQYTYRALWPSLGMARDWVFRIRTSDPNKFVILGARADAEEGDN